MSITKFHIFDVDCNIKNYKASQYIFFGVNTELSFLYEGNYCYLNKCQRECYENFEIQDLGETTNEAFRIFC
jgi:hypothetical protein